MRDLISRAEIEQKAEDADHVELGRYVFGYRADRGYFGLRRYRWRLGRNRQDHLLHRDRAVFSLGRGRSGARTHSRLTLCQPGTFESVYNATKSHVPVLICIRTDTPGASSTSQADYQ